MNTATALGRAFGILLAAMFAPALAGVLTRCGRMNATDCPRCGHNHGSTPCPEWGRP